MTKVEYSEGPGARKNFDQGMTKLFRAPKTPVKGVAPRPTAKPQKPARTSVGACPVLAVSQCDVALPTPINAL